MMILSHPEWPEVGTPPNYYDVGGGMMTHRECPRPAGNWLAKILTPGAKVFKKAKEGDGGFDIFVTGYVDADKKLVPKSFVIEPQQSQLFLTGIATAFPVTHVGLVADRSGYGVKGLMKQAGVIDSNWRGEWGVKLFNSSFKPITVESVLENPDAKAACQVVFVECYDGEFQTIEGDLPPSARGEAWQGSSDKR